VEKANNNHCNFLTGHYWVNTPKLSMQTRELFQRISWSLHRGGSFSIVSDSETLKSEFANAIPNPSIMTEYDLPSDKYVFCRNNFQKLTEATPGQVYRHLLEISTEAIVKQQAMDESIIQYAQKFLEQEELRYREFRGSLRKLTRGDINLTFVFDNLDLVNKNSLLDFRFFNSLRNLITEGIASFITVSSGILSDIIPTNPYGSDFSNYFMTYQLREYK